MTIIRVLTASLVLSIGLGFSVTSTTGSPGANKKHSNHKAAHHTDEWKFQDHEIRIILGYFRDTEGLPPGLAKRDTLPPGLAKQVRERGALPPGLQKRIQPLPVDLEIKLPKLPTSLIRVVIGVDVVLMDTFDNTILDVIQDVFG